MTYEPDRHHRRSIRASWWDYGGRGCYAITLCTANRELVFGDVVDCHVMLSHAGEIVAEEWLRTAEIRSEVSLDAWVVMPNHIHAIVVIHHDDDLDVVNASTQSSSQLTSRQPRSLGSLVAGFKAAATTRINAEQGTPGARIWQRNYYEHIVRDDRDLDRIRRYIDDNPRRWPYDPEHPDATKRR